MLTAYIICAILGGGMAALSAVFGGDAELDADLDAGFDADLGADIDLDLDVDADADVDVGGLGSIWMPFLSIQFWIFALAVFGLVGTSMRLLLGTTVFVELAAAVPSALLMGGGVSWTIRTLRQTQISSSMDSRAWLGSEGDALFPISETSPGKIRVKIGEREHELLAVSQDGVEIAAGERVVVIELDGTRAKVQRADKFLPLMDAEDETDEE